MGIVRLDGRDAARIDRGAGASTRGGVEWICTGSVADESCRTVVRNRGHGSREAGLRHEEAPSNAAEDLREVFVRRHETASTLIITNRPTQDWVSSSATFRPRRAILDRSLAHATIVPLTGKSYRLRQRTSTTDA